MNVTQTPFMSVFGLLVLLGFTLPAPAADLRPTAHFTWRMAERATLGAKFYQITRHAYAPGYVNPPGWIVVFDACEPETDENAALPIVSYTWRITKTDIGYSRRFKTKHCRVQAVKQPPARSPWPRPAHERSPRQPLPLRGISSVIAADPLTAGVGRPVNPLNPMPPRQPPPGRTPDRDEFIEQLPALGAYQVTLTVANRLGLTDTTRQVVVLKDYLIVVIGDSYAAGQGQPDRLGRVSHPLLACKMTKAATLYLNHFGGDHSHFKMDRPPSWLEPLAWRSYQSGQARAAMELERADPHSSVTLIDFATSGAKVKNVIEEPQMEFQLHKCDTNSYDHRPSAVRECSQLGEVKAAVGKRRIDAILVSIGGNDVGFSKVLLKALADHLRNSQELQDSWTVLRRLLPDYYRRLDREIRTRLTAIYTTIRQPRPGTAVPDIYVTGYPSNFFSDRQGNTVKGCGIFDAEIVGHLSGIEGVSFDDARLMRAMAEELNRQIKEAAQSLGWHFVPVAGVFRGHGYCAGGNSYLRFAEDSCKLQGDMEGTMHPNARGYAHISERLVKALRTYTINKATPPLVQPAEPRRH